MKGLHRIEEYHATDPVLAKRLCEEYKRRLMQRGCVCDTVEETQIKAQFHYTTKKGKLILVQIFVNSVPVPFVIPWMQTIADTRAQEIKDDNEN